MLQHVVRSTVIDAPIERVWAVLRDFNSHHLWHEVVAERVPLIDGGPETIGTGLKRQTLRVAKT